MADFYKLIFRRTVNSGSFVGIFKQVCCQTMGNKLVPVHCNIFKGWKDCPGINDIPNKHPTN